MAKRRVSGKSLAVKRSIATLRKRGLTRAKPRGRPGGSAYALIKKLQPVLEKKAQAVKIPSAKLKEYKGQFPIAGGKAIVPVRPGEKITVRKTGELTRVKTVGKRRLRFRVLGTGELTKPLPGNENTVYRLTWKNGYTDYRVGITDATKFMHQYDVGAFLQSIEIVNPEDIEDEAA